MSLANIAFLSSPASLKFSSVRYNEISSSISHPLYANTNFQIHVKREVPLLLDQRNMNFSVRSNVPLKTAIPSNENDETTNGHPYPGGIGILKFFQGKNIFITGATGLLGKAFIEKLLRSTSVGKIYVLIKADDEGFSAFDRFQKEIVNSELFHTLREKHGDSYDNFVKEKLIPVVGNICEPNLGLDTESARAIAKDVDVIVGSAANTILNDRYDNLLELNVNASQRLMRFSKTCQNLKMFVHISTAYVNGRQEGLILEKPLAMGGNGFEIAQSSSSSSSSSSSLPRADLADEISLVIEACKASTDYNATKDLKRLGQDRADHLGWYNSYHMTKAMAEMALDEMRERTPLLIIRPSIIESSLSEPFPGWIQGNRMFDPVIIAHGKGQLPAFLAHPHVPMDIIPVDVVVNATIAAIAKHGGLDEEPQTNVYQVASGVVNPLPFGEVFDIIYEHFKTTPLFKEKNIKKVVCFDNFEDFSKYTRDEISRMHNGTEKQYKAKVVYAERLCKMYEFAGYFRGRFDTSNTGKLSKEMSKDELLEFQVDANNVNWRDYFLDVHIPGLQKHVLNPSQ